MTFEERDYKKSKTENEFLETLQTPPMRETDKLMIMGRIKTKSVEKE